MYSVTEKAVAWLAALGYRASTRVPKDPPAEFVTVERVGGGVRDMVDRPRLAVQAWAADEPRAEEIANEVRLAALTGPLPEGVHSMAVNSGPYAFYDESTRCPRYQVVFDCAAQLSD